MEKKSPSKFFSRDAESNTPRTLGNGYQDLAHMIVHVRPITSVHKKSQGTYFLLGGEW